MAKSRGAGGVGEMRGDEGSRGAKGQRGTGEE